ncbi:MAG: type II toxin-antitoxin system PrlF family antitoxin [Acidobacteriaceae bacterium]
MESALTSKGQVTIPKEAREHLGLKPGDRVKFFIQPDGRVVILPKIHVSALRGILRTKKRASLADMDAAIEKGVLDDWKRGNKR